MTEEYSNNGTSAQPRKGLSEDLSALMDGELEELGTARVLTSLDNPAVRDQLKRYALMRSVLHSEELASAALNADISDAVRQRLQHLDSEAVVVSPAADTQRASNSAAPSAWLKPAMGFAIAASVAFLMVFSVDFWRAEQSANIAYTPAESSLPNTAGDNQLLAAQQSDALDMVSHISFSEGEFNTPYEVVVAADQELRKREQLLLKAQQQNTELQQHLREYLIRHTQQSVSNPVNTMAPIARVSNQGYVE